MLIFTVQEVCSGFESDVINNNTQEGSGEIISWQWSFPESNLNSIDTTDSITGLFYDPECDPLLNPTLQTVYFSSLLVTDEFGCSDEDTDSTTVFCTPQALFIPNEACQGQATIFDNQSSPQNDMLWTWTN